MEIVTLTTAATAIATVIFNKAIEKGGENLGQEVSNKIGQLRKLIRDKFQQEGVEGKLLKAQDDPSEKNQDKFKRELAEVMEEDEDFAKKLIELIKQLEKMEGGRQIMASGLELEGDLKAQDMKQKGGQNQEMLTSVKAKNIDLGNLTQEKSHNNVDEIMQFAGSWSDMPEEDFSDFCEEIEQRRQASSSRRISDETLFT